MKSRNRVPARSWYLLYLIDQTKEKGETFQVSNRELASLLGCVEKTITKNVKILRDLGWVNEWFEPCTQGLVRVLDLTPTGQSKCYTNPLVAECEVLYDSFNSTKISRA